VRGLGSLMGVIMKACLDAAAWRLARAGGAKNLLNRTSLAGRPRGVCRLALVTLALAAMTGCQSKPGLSGPGIAYENAKEFFARGHSANFDHALDTLESLCNADPSNDYTDRARVLRAVILGGEFEGFKALSDAYEKGAASAEDSAIRSEYNSAYRDTMRRASEISFGFAETAMQLTKGGQVPKGLTLEAPYPIGLPTGPSPTLEKIEKGERTDQVEQQDAALAAPSVGVAKVLADILGGDQDAAKSKMTAGPVSLDRAGFALFLASEIMSGAALYDKKHIDDPEKYKQLTGVAEGLGQAAAAALQESPSPDAAKRLKTLQDQTKAAQKIFRTWMQQP